jgi:hypothetical protein
MESPPVYFSELTDPRVECTREHDPEDILFIAIASIYLRCGELVRHGRGKLKEEWLKMFLRLPGGNPSHDTFNRIFSGLDPAE